MAPFDGKYEASCMTAILMCALSITIYKIFANQMNCQQLDLKNIGKGQEKQNIRLEMFDSVFGDLFRIFATHQLNIYAKS